MMRAHPRQPDNTMRYKAFAFAAALLVPAAGAQSLLQKADKDDLVFMRDEEPAMKKAFAKASASLNDFLAVARAAAPTHTSFAMKVAISQGKKTEYFWVSDFAEKADGSFEGEIANEPRMVKHVKLGQRYSFPRVHIVDWTYIDTGSRAMAGNFTLCALLTKEPAAQAEAMKKRYRLDCDWLTP